MTNRHVVASASIDAVISSAAAAAAAAASFSYSLANAFVRGSVERDIFD